MLSFRSAPLLIPSVSVFLSVQVSGWRFSSGIVSELGVFHQTKKVWFEFAKKYSSAEWNNVFPNLWKGGQPRKASPNFDLYIIFLADCQKCSNGWAFGISTNFGVIGNFFRKFSYRLAPFRKFKKFFFCLEQSFNSTTCKIQHSSAH